MANPEGHDPFANLPVRPGDRVHVRHALILPVRRADPETFSDGMSELLERGTSFTITADILEANEQRDGTFGVFSKIGEEGALLGLGAWPDQISPLEPNDPRWQVARDQALREAKSIPDRKQQREALNMVELRFGPAMPTSRTTRYVPTAES